MKAPSRFLEDVVALARLAGERILDIYHSDFRVGHREDDTLLTAADLVSHHCLTEGLQILPGAYPVLSEESAPPPFEERREWETYWLIDPLDGAGEFIGRHGEFTLNIALIHQHKPVLGLVYAPTLETCYFASEGCGAFKKVGQGTPEEIHVRMRSPQDPRVVGSCSPRHPAELDAYLEHLGAHDLQHRGGSLAFCLIAEGKADLYPCFSPSAEWDTAAAQCIVEAAGGSITDLQGKALRYNANPSLLNPYFLAFGDKTRDWGISAKDIEECAPFMAAKKKPSPLLKAAVALAIEAGDKILEIYHSDFRVGHKKDDSPLTAADLAAHHCLTEALHGMQGAYPVLSEESAELAFEERSSWETYWLIDPLDGTKEFIKRNGEFTVNIALIQGHQPVLGVVHAPVMETCYFAERGGGAFKQVGNSEPQEIAVRSLAPQRLSVAGSRSHGTAELDVYLSRLGEHELKSIGSSLKFCLVAEGSADLYPRIGPTSEWDTAAAQCVVEVAGGAVTDLRGRPLSYNMKPSLLNPYFLVFGDQSRDWTAFAEGING